ncbi:hypothetical protein PROFUN_03395 [Planoprotostelium fungivorum]|uniref:tRNA-dihydrouridine(16/17) synthase [NAD(P)(+)] n=1 Tax=Planoprotostelium fungivorum TaxID=1890364 RepID=A0A2P6NWH9_9EUKA|nr:hypothetical protein PROFUN_03395 [Planoprotostelium fungivorum]
MTEGELNREATTESTEESVNATEFEEKCCPDADEAEEGLDEMLKELVATCQTTPINKLGGYEFFRSLGSPKYAVAPMVDQSELAFRMLCRNHGATIAYTPMLHSKIFSSNVSYRQRFFTTCPEDRPLVVQFCGNEPYYVLKAALHVQDSCDAVDLNLGCPQRIAKKGRYGSFMMDHPEKVYQIVKTLHENLKVPVFCKIRVFDEYEKTLQFAKMLESAGCQLLTVHGRTRIMKGKLVGVADWEVIRKLKQELTIPVFSNGNIRNFNDIQECLKITQTDGIMSAEGLLRFPGIFSGEDKDAFEMSREYLQHSEKYNTHYTWAKDHICKMLAPVVESHQQLREALFRQKDYVSLRKQLDYTEEMIKSNAVEPDPTFVRIRTPGDIFENFECNFMFSPDE